MKVGDIYKHLSLIQSAGDATGKEKAQVERESVPKETVNSDAKVDISKTSITFNRVRKLVEAVPPERVEKIQRIKEQVVSGQYQVDSKKVAEKMLKESLIDFLEE